MSHEFRPTCPRCGDRLRVGQQRCECGAISGAVPVRRVRTPKSVPEPRPEEVTTGRYVVRETQGFRINFPIKTPPSSAGIEVVVLDTACNYRRVASFTSERQTYMHGRAEMYELARQQARERCELLNALDEIGSAA